MNQFAFPRCVLCAVSFVVLAAGTTNLLRSVKTPFKSVKIAGVPHVRQQPDFCGEACAEMYLKKLGKPIDQRDVFNFSGLDPALGRGCHTRDLATALRRIGFRTGNVWYSVTEENSEQEIAAEFTELHKDLLAGVPSIVCMHYERRPKATEHFRLILGYDAQTDEILFHEPATDDGAYQRMKRETLLTLWPLKYDVKEWTLVRLRLEPGKIAAGEENVGFSDADYAQHIMRLKQRLPSDDFHIVLCRPFVVIGDETPLRVRQRATQTVAWSVSRLKKDYFTKNPDCIIDIWLFKDKASYEKYSEQLFGSKPHTPFGYYSSYGRSLVMNIRTGGGTLVHEIVHPFIASDFPECPPWFNEGLASLYEQCRDNDGHIWGLTNWRLEGLQRAIRADRLPTFESLCGATADEFYTRDKGTNYAQARYLCYFLQEKGLLAKYYHEFRRNVQRDSTGIETLQRLLDEDDMAAFKKQWEEFVLNLRFP